MFEWKCYQCGYCCKVRACDYGKWDALNWRCYFLLPDNTCSKYHEIIEIEKNSLYPMFGCGCSSPLFNTVRQAKIDSLKSAK
jgi:hypothetical protein